MVTVLQFLSYNVLIGYGILGQFRFDPLMQWLVYAPFYAVLVGHWWYGRKKEQRLQTASEGRPYKTYNKSEEQRASATENPLF
jgi:hypothetical protein